MSDGTNVELNEHLLTDANNTTLTLDKNGEELPNAGTSRLIWLDGSILSWDLSCLDLAQLPALRCIVTSTIENVTNGEQTVSFALLHVCVRS